MLTNQEIARLCRSMELLIHSGVGLADGIFLLAREEENSSLETMGKMLDRGETLSAAMEAGGLFPAYAAALVNIGEETGRTEEALHSLADYFEEKERTRRLIRSAVAYPGMLFALMLAVLAVLLVKVLPVFDRVYASLGASMAGTAGLLLHLGQLLEAALPVLFFLLVAAVICVLLFSGSSGFREKVLSGWNKHFGDKGISARFHNAQFARALAMGLASGLTLEESIDLARLLLTDIPAAEERCGRCARLLAENASLAEALGGSGFLPAASCRLLSVGLRGGNGDQVMSRIADQLMEEAGQALEDSVSRVEPAMVMAASLLVGIILLSVMLPLANIMSSIG